MKECFSLYAHAISLRPDILDGFRVVLLVFLALVLAAVIEPNSIDSQPYWDIVVERVVS